MPVNRFVAGLADAPERSGQPRTYTRNCGTHPTRASELDHRRPSGLAPACARSSSQRRLSKRVFSCGRALDCGHQSGTLSPDPCCRQRGAYTFSSSILLPNARRLKCLQAAIPILHLKGFRLSPVVTTIQRLLIGRKTKSVSGTHVSQHCRLNVNLAFAFRKLKCIGDQNRHIAPHANSRRSRSIREFE